MLIFRRFIITILALLFLGEQSYAQGLKHSIKHVVLISIDGFHTFDLKRFVLSHSGSTLAKLSKNGITYSNAWTPAPADSFPGLMALITGGKPGQTGIYFDISYDRALSPAGSHCATKGTMVTYDETIDKPGVEDGSPIVDTSLLPLDPKENCSPVFPHMYLRVNTIFNVIGKAGGYTAWIDKHHVYEIVNGPHGPNVNDLYTPEIGEDFEGIASSEVKNNTTSSIDKTEAYDTKKMDALINEMSGFTHDKKHHAPVPTMAGMNFQAVNVAQKKAGYKDAEGTPSPDLENAISHCNSELGRLVSVLRTKKLLDSTLIIITAKHGNGPTDRTKLRRIEHNKIVTIAQNSVPNSIAGVTSDRSAYIWLNHKKDTKKLVKAFLSAKKKLGIKTILYGKELSQYYHTSVTDSRVPDIVILPQPGVIYIKPNDKKLAEHGGWSKDDRNVALLFSNMHLKAKGTQINSKVSTTQVAPTILKVLGLNPNNLKAVKEAHTKTLVNVRQ